MKIGFVGLGDQGTPMALRLLEAGFELAIYARRPEVIERFAGLGATVATTLNSLGAACNVVSVCVVDDDQVREVALGDNLLAGMQPGSILVVHSTVSPDTCRQLAAVAGEMGITVADAPVSGGRVRSYSGDLTIMVGADPAIFVRIEPVLRAYGSTVKRMGPVGSGQLTKLINNYFTAAHMETAAHELRLIRALGVDPVAAAEVLATCSGSSAIFAMAAANDVQGVQHDESWNHDMQLLAKDVTLLRRLLVGTSVDVSTPTDVLIDTSMSRWLPSR
jgi:3-hydroxyisobutyrate dehydrogenase